MDDFDLGLVTNDGVLAVNQDRLCSQGYCVANEPRKWEIWVKDLADGSKAVAMFNLSHEDQVRSVTAERLELSGNVRDLWRQSDIGPIEDQFSATVSPHGVAFFKVTR